MVLLGTTKSGCPTLKRVLSVQGHPPPTHLPTCPLAIDTIRDVIVYWQGHF